MTAAVWVALAASACYALATPLQHVAASGEPGQVAGLRLVAHLVRSPIWLAGIGVNGLGLLLHADALHLGTLTIVQPLLVTSLVFALPARAALERRWPHPRTLVWAVATAGGLVLFLIVANPTPGQATPNQPFAAVLMFAGMALAGLAVAVAAVVREPRVVGLAYGVATGVLYGLVAGALKMATVNAAQEGMAGLVDNWPVYALTVVGVWGLVVNQRGYQVAPLAVSLPALTVLDPMVSIVFGALVFGERPSDTPVAVVLEGLGLAVMTAGVVALARAEAAR